jgi:SAM-dependent methyltransferase
VSNNEAPNSQAPNAFGIAGYTSATYGDSFADVYDAWYENLNDNGFVHTLAGLLPARESRVLELGVGTGRLLERLIETRPSHHDQLVGVDTSEKMLEIAARKASLSNCTFVQDDFSRTLPAGPFDLAFVGYNTLFNLPNAEAIGDCVSLVASVLNAGGRLVVDAVAPVAVDHGDHVGLRSMTTTDVVLTATHHNVEEQRITGQFISISETGGVRLRPWSVSYLTPSQLDALAVEAGFSLESRTEDGTKPFGPESPRHVSVYLLR